MKNEIVLFKNQNVKLEVNMKDETVWLSLDQMAKLFDRDKSVISRHIKNALEEELDNSVVAKFATTAKDGKTYPYIALSKDKEPRLKIAYKPNDKDHYYFGPYTSSSSAYKIIDLLNKIFPLRKCSYIPSSPCLYYHLHQCLGPCINKNLASEYKSMVNDIKHFMQGDDSKIKANLILQMKKASEELNFEKAGEYKRIIDSIDHIQEKQSITLSSKLSLDVIATSSREGYFALSIITYRNGLLLGKNVFVNEQEGENNDEQVISLIFQYYQKHEIPKEILIGNKKYQESLINILQTKVNIPSRGIKKEILSKA